MPGKDRPSGTEKNRAEIRLEPGSVQDRDGIPIARRWAERFFPEGISGRKIGTKGRGRLAQPRDRKLTAVNFAV